MIEIADEGLEKFGCVGRAVDRWTFGNGTLMQVGVDLLVELTDLRQHLVDLDLLGLAFLLLL